MNNAMRIVMATAAVVVVALIALNLMPRNASVGGPPPAPVPTSTPTPTPSATPVPTLPPSGQVAPGTYRADFMMFTLPSGWSSFAGATVLKASSDPPTGMAVGPWRNVATIYTDPCHWQTSGVSIGPKVDDLVAALVAQKGGSGVIPADVTIDGFHGKQIDLVVPMSVRFGAPSSASDCDGGQYKLWAQSDGSDRYNQGPGQHDLLDILDVNGQTLVIGRSFYAANTAADTAELQAIVDSIKITP